MLPGCGYRRDRCEDYECDTQNQIVQWAWIDETERQSTQPHPPHMDHHDRSAAWHATAWRVFGAASVAIGIVNAFIPLLPTTVFLLIGAWAWGKGAPEWRARLLAHPRWGEALRLWANGRQVSRRGKRMATLGIATSWLLSATWIGPTTAVLAVGLGLAALVAWLWCRPEPGSVPSSGNFVAGSVDHG